jgi:hypothetical protein
MGNHGGKDMAKHEYLFDVKLFAAVRVKAESEDEARTMLKKAFDCADCNGGAWPNGDPITFEASLDDPANDELIEVDGEFVE